MFEQTPQNSNKASLTAKNRAHQTHTIDTASKTQEELIKNISATLSSLGEDINREGLQRTPLRYARSMQFLTSGYNENIANIVKNALFKSEKSELVLIRDTEFFSLCEHHILPFFGRAHIAYVPDKTIIGLSKIPRIINVFSRRLQIQERLGAQIADTINEILKPKGVAVILEAYHMCKMMRGVQKQNSLTITHAMRGVFSKDTSTRMELFQFLSDRPKNSSCAL